MVKKIMRDVFFLRQPSKDAVPADAQIAQDLMDTLSANSARCVGMAANMIGQKKKIIIVNVGFMNVIMYNPVILSGSGKYKTEEGCLSLDGVRPCERYETIEVEYQDINWNKQRQTFKGRTAQIIQHEVDHLSGIII